MAFGLVAGISLFVAGTLAQTGALAPAADSASAPSDPKAELSKVEASITVSKQKLDQLRKEIAEMSGDSAKQSAALVAAGQRVKLAEIETDAAEEKLTELLDKEKGVRDKLSGEQSDIASLLTALQAISTNPPPALIVNPEDALSSARGAVLLSAILPQLKGRAAVVSGDLEKLVAIRQDAEKQTDTLKANLAVLKSEQLRIATLIAARKAGLERANADLSAEQQRAETLAEKATSLRALMASLTENVPAVGAAAAAADQASAEARRNPGPPLTEDAVKVALAKTGRTTPAFPISRAKGFLTAPAVGVQVTDYGARDGFGGVSHGLFLVTRADAQVVAPADGWVMYKGPYLDYGQIVILNAGQGYSILLAGLGAIDVDLGQFVLLGEPIGHMGTRTMGGGVTTSAGVSRPTLYIELRDENGPIDPSGWWASDQGQTKDG